MNFFEMSINERVFHLRTEMLHITLESFGNEIEMTRSAVSLMEKGKRIVSERSIKLICSVFSVNEHWLRTGEGEVFIKPETFSLDEYAKEKGLTALEYNLMKAYMSIDAAIREELLAYLKSVFITEDETSATVQADADAEEEEEFDPYMDEEVQAFIRAKKRAKDSESSASRTTGSKENTTKRIS